MAGGTKKSEAARNYHREDTDMMRVTQLLHDLYVKHLADFTAFNPNLNNAFATQWQQAIDDAWIALSVKYRSPTETVLLINALNKAWAFAQQTSAASKLIYKLTNPARYRAFLLTK